MLSFEQVSALMWSLTALCILLTIGRYLIRMKIQRQLHLDDLAHLAALIWLVITVALAQTMFAPATTVLQAAEGTTPASAVSKFRRLQTPLWMAFFLSQWSVKIGFMMFYQQVFWMSKTFRGAWWSVITFVIMGFWAVLASTLTQCGEIKNINDPVACSAHEQYQQYARVTIGVVNLITNLAVMVLPLFMIARLSIQSSQKLGLALLGSLCIVTVSMEIVRITHNFKGGFIAYGILYGTLTANLTVIISCIPTYRLLLGSDTKTTRKNVASGAIPRERRKVVPRVPDAMACPPDLCYGFGSFESTEDLANTATVGSDEKVSIRNETTTIDALPTINHVAGFNV